MAWVSYTTTSRRLREIALQGGMKNVWEGVHAQRTFGNSTKLMDTPLARLDGYGGGLSEKSLDHTKITDSFYHGGIIALCYIIFSSQGRTGFLQRIMGDTFASYTFILLPSSLTYFIHLHRRRFDVFRHLCSACYLSFVFYYWRW